MSGERVTVATPLDLLESLVDAEACSFDHHGGCQAHGYLWLDQGEMCPQEELKRIIEASTREGSGTTEEREKDG